MRALLPLLLLVTACDTAGDDGTDTDTTDTTDTEVASATWARVRNEVLEPSCAFSVCHGGATGGLELDGTDADYDRLVDVASTGKPSETLVIPGDAANSYLVKKLEGADDILGAPMPSGGPLDDARLQLVKDWIDAGAPRN